MIYFPMSCRILTQGHIQCLEELSKQDFVIVGLLTAKALKGYKDEIVPYKQRKYILDTIAFSIEDVFVVPQNSLDPSKNIKKYKCNALASGDGFEPIEQKAIVRYNLRSIDIRLPKETGKRFSSTKIINKQKLDNKRHKIRHKLPRRGNISNLPRR